MTERLQQCISALQKASSDSEKLAVLMLVSKTVQPEMMTDDEMEQLYHAISSSFLKKLMRSKNIPDGCNEDVYTTLAISLLATFVPVPHLLTQEEVCENLGTRY